MSILKYKICHSDLYGRYLVTDCDINVGEVIFREEPAVVGPLNITNQLLCFSCMKPIFFVRLVCSKCKVAPLCSDLCEKLQTFHLAGECELLEQKRDVMVNNIPRLIDILMHLRLWIIYKSNSKLWEEINQMESHEKERRNKYVWKSVETNIIKTFEDLNIIPPNEKNSMELIQKISGILDVNTFEIRSQTYINESPLRGLYLEPSLMAHKCISNTHLTVDDNFRLTVYASVPIQKNEMVCFNYTSPFMGFAERKTYLREGKYFECKCSLCKDTTEAGSNISTLLCPKCKKGEITMKNALEFDPYDKLTRWTCNQCKKSISGSLIKTVIDVTSQLIDELDECDIKEMENLCKKLSTSLHKNHFLMLTLKQKLLGAYKQEIMSPYVELYLLKRMIQLGNELVDVLNIMEPGISRLKGILLYELHLPMTMLANREYALQKITLDELIEKLKEGRHFLKKSLNVMLLEPPTCPEGLLAKEALQKMKQLNQNISDIKSLSQN